MHPDVADLARAIQLALAPAFLLSGIAALINAMVGRVARILDRGRAIADGEASSPRRAASIGLSELPTLEQRRHLASVAITATTIAALLVSLVVAMLFVEVVLGAPMRWLISALFVAGMVALVIGLAYFLREVHMAMRTVRIVVPQAEAPRGSTAFLEPSLTTPGTAAPGVRHGA